MLVLASWRYKKRDRGVPVRIRHRGWASHPSPLETPHGLGLLTDRNALLEYVRSDVRAPCWGRSADVEAPGAGSLVKTLYKQYERYATDAGTVGISAVRHRVQLSIPAEG